jgi:ABC-2 type transport system permease protein
MSNDTAIHDLGYRRYEGAREGPRGAWLAIFSQGVRTMFGLGRNAKAKVVPVFVVVVTALQVIGALFASSVSQGQLPVRYGNVLEGSIFLYVLFIAAQAPEIFSRDQQHRILPLVLTRASSRQAYVTARLASVVASVFILVFGCLLLLYLGEIGLATDPSKRFREIGTRFFPVLAVSALVAMALGGISAGVSSWSPRRAFATASIIALVLLTVAVSEGLADLIGIASRPAQMLNLPLSIRNFTMVMIGETNRGFETNPPLSAWVYAAQMFSFAVVGVILLQLRMRRLET